MTQKQRTLFLTSALCLLTSPLKAVPPDWQYSQEVTVQGQGLAKAKLPLETLSAAQPSLADLRLQDASGRDVSYLIDRPVIQPASVLRLENMKLTMQKGRTIITGRVPQAVSNEYDALALQTPAADFIKALTLEASSDGKTWQTLVQAYPIFRHFAEAASTGVTFPRKALPYLRVTLNDALTPPIAVEGISVMTPSRRVADLQPVEAVILEKSSDATRTEITLSLPAGNLLADSLVLETPEPAFSRHVEVVTKVFTQGNLQDVTLGEGTVWRLAIDQRQREQLTVPLRNQIPGNQLYVRILNGDNQPLTIPNIRVEVIPTSLVFYAQEGQRYTLLSGSPASSSKDYDVAALRDHMKDATYETATLGPLVVNSAYKTPEALPGVQESGAALDVSAWRYRKPVQFQKGGIQRLELDLESLAHDKNRVSDLRLIRSPQATVRSGGREGLQIPYVVDYAGVSRSLVLPAVPEKKAAPSKHILDRRDQEERTNRQRWTLTLPYQGLPLTHLQVASATSMFQRTVRLYEERQDERGDVLRQSLGQSVWTHIPGRMQDDLTLTPGQIPDSDKLFLEIDNGDNPSIQLLSVKAYYRSPRILFKASPGTPLYLYYGQEAATAPTYDLSLVSQELLSTPPLEASLGAEEVLKTTSWWQVPIASAPMRYAFWAVMGLVVIGLLAVIAKFLPAEEAPKGAK